VLRRHGILDWFHSLHFSYDAGSRKPSPAMMRSALGELGVRPTEAVMVGDRRPNDVAAGRAAGTGTIWVRSDDGGGPAADFKVESLAEVPGLLGS
jgi:HAD superfamily hydrolase (TIGR01509 family)